MKKRAKAISLKKNDLTMVGGTVGGRFELRWAVRGLCEDSFPIGKLFFLAEKERITKMRQKEEYVELFPYDNAPLIYNQDLLEKYGAIEFCEKFGVEHPLHKNLAINLSPNHTYIFAKVSNGAPSEELLAAIDEFCKAKHIDYLTAE